MTTLETRARSIVEERDEGRWPHTRHLLQGLSGIYGLGMSIRNQLYHQGLLSSDRLPCKVISVGNLTVGGTGKTPMTIYLARLVSRLGYRVALLSRGYGGKAEKLGGLVFDGRQLLMSSEQAGDEPCMMAAHLAGIPVLVGRNRRLSAQRAIAQFEAQVLILDDGYQHLGIARDLNILLLDSRRPLGNTHLLPRGPLRESVRSIQRADVIVLTRSGQYPPANQEYRGPQGHPLPLFHSWHRPYIERMVPAGTPCQPPNDLQAEHPLAGLLFNKRVLAFAGLAHNESFWQSVIELGGCLTQPLGFDDHHRYNPDDLDRISTCARQQGCDCLATTEKDYMRLDPGTRWPLDLIIVGVRIDFRARTDDWHDLISRTLQTAPQDAT